MVTRDFEFTSGGITLSGIIEQPKHKEAEALIIFVHGTGKTNIRDGWYLDLRQRFSELGIASVVWDKPGTGRSEGTFDENQSLESCAREVLDVVTYLQSNKILGSGNIGIWSASRGSLIAPDAMSQESDIEFWISQSGSTIWDGKYYQLKENLPLEGYTPEETNVLMQEWIRGRRIMVGGGDYDAYLDATRNLRANQSVIYIAGDLTGTRDEYNMEQKAFLTRREEFEINENMSFAQVRNFELMLVSLDLKVLALFGGRDKNVNWSETKELYESTIGQNPNATLEVYVFPEGNHLIHVSETGSMREVEENIMTGEGQRCEDYYSVQLDWLKKNVLSQ